MQKTFAILLATYNGEKFIRKQLDSLENQTFKNWRLFVIDDGSTDTTVDILKEYQTRWGEHKITIRTMPNQGCAKTFLTLVCDPNIQANYYAYSDQDDIWDQDKIDRAVTVLETLDASKPLLYGSRARLSDENDNVIGELPIKRKPLSFSHALVQCLATGNTMVFNQKAKDILMKVEPMAFVGNHDWWTGIAVSACGGLCYYDPISSISYRQHGKNVLGFADNYYKRYKKALKRVMNNDFVSMNNLHIKAMRQLYENLSPSSKKILDNFEKSRQGNVFKRLYYLHKAGVYRQDTSGTLAVYLAQAIGKF